ncbi:AGL019Wp [Eremothecium gossypii ATCC 10895]|uniref:AGL019Wp n=1 Tax=Eremothecium gossypii (strain ATCC 10895 / CBS 109.51 / FGSC 9923 / NRRL Y-1056) TaxID=284811 RepID=Q750H2_EREGS|nr:AGL019Wp [Eremothecium gossypii ATCC 10895]AAS54471.2 AGL019Wp [Eremothecium gossypii ATCC 10895]AEY98803.1 FAGL019Wp [Eremothecium gossypii FDAG1]
MLDGIRKVLDGTRRSLLAWVYADTPASDTSEYDSGSSQARNIFHCSCRDDEGAMHGEMGVLKKRLHSDDINVPQKRSRPAGQGSGFPEALPQKVAQTKEAALVEKIDRLIAPASQLKLEKDPFNWDSPITTPSADRPSDAPERHFQYGTAFYRRRRRFQSLPRAGAQRSLLADPADEISYLRMVFNGEYKPLKMIQEERKQQLRLLQMDSRDTGLKRSILNLTERIRSVLIDTRQSQNQDADVMIVKERIIDPLSLKRKAFYAQKLKFDRSILSFEDEFKSYKKLLEERKKIQDEIRKQQRGAVLVPMLTDSDMKDIQLTLARTDKGVLNNKNNFEVTVRDFKTLAPRRWLNDTIIEYFMKQIELKYAHTVAFNSFFYSTLSERGYQGVRRWMKRKKVKIQDLHKIFVPINLDQSHWALGIIDLTKKKVMYADSLTSRANSMSFAIMKDLQNYVIEESGGSMGKDFELEHIACPQQPNGFDCGVYVCTNALYLSEDQALAFDHQDAARMRNYIGHMILSEGKK